MQLLAIARYYASLRLALHHHKRTLHSVQLRILGWKLPKYLFAGTLIPALMSLLVHYFPSQVLADGDVAKQQMSVDILSVSIVITVWTAIFTIAIGCIIVRVMKGPTYVADSYKMPDSNYPKKGDRGRVVSVG